MTQGFLPISDSKEESATKGKKEHFLATTGFWKHFATVKDPRIKRTQVHKLLDIIAIALLAVLSGAEGWEEIET